MLEQPPVPSEPEIASSSIYDEPVQRASPRSIMLSIGMLATAILLAVLIVLPTPYAVNGPGPTRDVLGEHDGTPLIQITGADTFPSTGELRLTTVSGTGGPGFPSTIRDVLAGWRSPSSVVLPAEVLYPPDASQEEINDNSNAEMVSSQENATVAALTELGYEVPATLVVAGTVEGTDAEGKVQKGDVIVSIDGIAVPDYATLLDHLGDVEPGLDHHVDGHPQRRDGRRARSSRARRPTAPRRSASTSTRRSTSRSTSRSASTTSADPAPAPCSRSGSSTR